MKRPTLLLKNAQIYTPSEVIERGHMLVKDGLIAAVYTERNRDENEVTPSPVAEITAGVDEVIDVEGKRLIPGFIDVHVHGGNGYDAMSGQVEAVDGMSQFHASKGTTAICPTTLTADMNSTERAIVSITKAMKEGTKGADVVGLHLEGPFLNAVRSGAQNPQFVRDVNIQELDRYIRLSEGNIRLMTIAPELEGALEMIQYGVQEGITMSIGHSDATYATVDQAQQHGATHITHLFNGMRPLHHREPGVTGAAMMSDDLTVELICDGYHVDQKLINFIFKIKPLEKIVLITDAVSAAGLPNGNDYELGGLPCYKKDGQVRLKQSNQLAGSCLTMDEALRNVLAFTKQPLEKVLPTLTINPAKQIRMAHKKGSIQEGKDADLVILNEDYTVNKTLVRGKIVYDESLISLNAETK